MSGFTRQSPAVVRVESHLRAMGNLGATDAELEDALGLSRATVCAARKLLVDEGLVEWSGDKREIPLGQPPKIWRMKPVEPQAHHEE